MPNSSINARVLFRQLLGREDASVIQVLRQPGTWILFGDWDGMLVSGQAHAPDMETINKKLDERKLDKRVVLTRGCAALPGSQISRWGNHPLFAYLELSLQTDYVAIHGNTALADACTLIRRTYATLSKETDGHLALDLDVEECLGQADIVCMLYGATYDAILGVVMQLRDTTIEGISLFSWSYTLLGFVPPTVDASISPLDAPTATTDKILNIPTNVLPSMYVTARPGHTQHLYLALSSFLDNQMRPARIVVTPGIHDLRIDLLPDSQQPVTQRDAMRWALRLWQFLYQQRSVPIVSGSTTIWSLTEDLRGVLETRDSANPAHLPTSSGLPQPPSRPTLLPTRGQPQFLVTLAAIRAGCEFAASHPLTRSSVEDLLAVLPRIEQGIYSVWLAATQGASGADPHRVEVDASDVARELYDSFLMRISPGTHALRSEASFHPSQSIHKLAVGANRLVAELVMTWHDRPGNMIGHVMMSPVAGVRSKTFAARDPEFLLTLYEIDPISLLGSGICALVHDVFHTIRLSSFDRDAWRLLHITEYATWLGAQVATKIGENSSALPTRILDACLHLERNLRNRPISVVLAGLARWPVLCGLLEGAGLDRLPTLDVTHPLSTLQHEASTYATKLVQLLSEAKADALAFGICGEKYIEHMRGSRSSAGVSRRIQLLSAIGKPDSGPIAVQLCSIAGLVKRRTDVFPEVSEDGAGYSVTNLMTLWTKQVGENRGGTANE